MLMSNFILPPSVTPKEKQEVLLRVHAALHNISYLVPRAPSKLLLILAKRMPKFYIKDQDSLIVTLTYVDNLLKLENNPIGKVVGSMVLMVVMERMRDLDLEIGWDDILQEDSSRGMFDMELEDAVESTMNEGDKFPVAAQYQNTSDGNVVSELLEKLMVLSFDHLRSCQNSGRLDESWHQKVSR